jgi:ATPase subunit of ABC transporter with duplicated ATPase domains
VLFSGDEGKKKLGALSGGEAARLLFARQAVEKPNVLILDEPTNHLDLEAIEALVAAVREYDGTVVFVSHDRWFVNELATRVVEITPEGVRDYPGSYDEYLARAGEDHLDAQEVLRRARESKRAARLGER